MMQTWFITGASGGLAAPFDIRATMVKPGGIRTKWRRRSSTAPTRAQVRSDAGAGPLRLALGSDAYAVIRASLLERLAALEAQKELAYSTDADDTEREKEERA